MILCDSRIGSEHLVPALTDLGYDTELTTLEFGDVAFLGKGPDDSGVMVGIELKKLHDLLGSFASGRFTNHQLPGLCAAYDTVVLLVEGRYRASFTGRLQAANERTWKDDATICNWADAGYGFRPWTYQEVEGRLMTLQIKSGIRVARTANGDETARYIGALYDWWTGSEYAEHRSHEAGVLKAQMPYLRPPTMRERIAAQLPHIGNKTAPMAAGAFDSVREMINADAEAWMRLPRIGKKVAQDIVAAVTGK